jgi:intracellular septation protein
MRRARRWDNESTAGIVTVKGLLTAFRPLVFDMASSLFLVVLLALHADVLVATVASIALGFVQIIYLRVQHLPVARLQIASLGLVLLFGVAGLVFNDIRFLMAKPTIIELVIAAVMLQRGWMLRYLPPSAAGYGEDLMITWGYVWAGFMMLLAVTNLAVAIWFSARWVTYKATAPTFGPLVLFLIQYASMRVIVGRREAAAGAAAAPILNA